jgi:hypothetical protein
MKYRLINKHISDIVANENFHEHRCIAKSNSPTAITLFVNEQSKIPKEYLSVLTVIPGNSISVHSYSSMKWIKP